MPRGDQLTRQWKLVQLLAGRVGRTLAQLKSEFGVSKRTIQRDIAVLESAGFPLTTDARNGTVFWRLMDGFHAAAPISLTLAEQMALCFSKGLFKPLQGTPVYESLASAMQKIGAQLPPQSLRLMNRAISVSSFGWKDYRRSKQVIEALTRAVVHRFSVGISHRAVQHDEPVEREVDPYRLWYVNNALYLVAHDHWKADLRVFAVDRIQWVKLTHRRFEIPEDFDFDKFAESAFSMIGGEAQEVRIWFSPWQARFIRERIWHPSQKIDTCPDGSIVLTIQVADLGEVKRWLIGFGAEAEVIGPDSLRQQITDECAEVMRRASRAGEAKVLQPGS